jgi:hypothetical protein
VAVALASLGERLGIGSIVALVIEFAGIALAR